MPTSFLKAVFFGSSSAFLREFFGNFPKPPRSRPEAAPKKPRMRYERNTKSCTEKNFTGFEDFIA